MYYGGDTANPSRVGISNWQDPETVPTITLPTNNDQFDDTTGGYQDIARQDGQAVTCLLSYPGGVLCGKENSVYSITGNTFNPFGADVFRYDKITDASGIVGPWAAALCENVAAWVSRESVWAWSPGQGEQNIGIPIADIITAIPKDYKKFVSCVYRGSILRIDYTASGGTYNTEWLEYDFRTGAWTRHDGQNAAVAIVAKNPGDNNELYYGDSNANYIYQAETGYTDGATAITAKVLTGILTEGTDTLRLRYFDMVADGTTAAVNGTLSIYRDKNAALGDTADATKTYSLQGSNIRLIEGSVSDAQTAHRIQMAFQVTASEQVRIRAMFPYVKKIR